jgi:hypothetical protein
VKKGWVSTGLDMLVQLLTLTAFGFFRSLRARWHNLVFIEPPRTRSAPSLLDFFAFFAAFAVRFSSVLGRF